MHELSKPIPIPDGDDANELFNIAYTAFCMEIVHKETRPTLFGKFIYIDTKKTLDGEKMDGFWHVASIGVDDSKYDMYPCYNDNTYVKCIYRCKINNPNNFLKYYNSIPCLYRADKVRWIKEIIELANQNNKHKNLKIWKQKRKNGDKHLLIRYINESVDYVIIFKINYKNNKESYYRLITAYPVVLKSYKRRFDKEYQQYISSK